MTQAQRWDRRYRDAGWPVEPDPSVVELTADLAPGSALDVGCGTGRHAVWLARRGWRVTGVDASRVGLELAHAAAREAEVTVELVRRELPVDELPDGPFDLVLVANLHTPPPERDQVLASCATRVASGGVLVAVGHHVAGLGSGSGGPDDVQRRWEEAMLRRALEGLEVEILQRWEREVTAAAGDPPVRLIQAVARARRR